LVHQPAENHRRIKTARIGENTTRHNQFPCEGFFGDAKQRFWFAYRQRARGEGKSARTAAWKLAETTANTAYDTAVLNADNAFAAEETAATLDYDAAIAAARDDWNVATSNAFAAHENSISVATAIWQASEVAARTMFEITMTFTIQIAQAASVLAESNLQLALSTARTNADVAAENAYLALESALGGSTSMTTTFAAISNSGSNSASSWGWGGFTIAGEFFKGMGQGVLNTVNGVQDALIGMANIPAAGVNMIAFTEEQLGIINPEDSIRIPYIPSPDWSRDMVVYESDGAHAVSKVAGGIAVLAGVSAAARAASAAGAAGRTLAGPNCFVAGTEVHMDEAIAETQSSSGVDLVAALACVPLAVAGYTLSRRKRKSGSENSTDAFFAAYELEQLHS